MDGVALGKEIPVCKISCSSFIPTIPTRTSYMLGNLMLIHLWENARPRKGQIIIYQKLHMTNSIFNCSLISGKSCK